MAAGFNRSLKSKLIVMFLLVSIIPIAIVGYLSYSSGRSALKVRLLSSLTSIAKSKEAAITLHLEGKSGRTIDYASDGFISDSIVILNNMGVNIIGNRKGVVDEINKHLLKNKIPLDKDIFGINIVNTSGQVISSTMESEIGVDLSLDKCFTEAMENDYGIAYVSDVSMSDRFESKFVSFEVSAPLNDRRTGQKLGVLVNYYKTTTINNITTDRDGLGTSGEVYIVNKDNFMITDSRFTSDSVFKQKVDTEPVYLFQNQKDVMTGIYPDYRGVPILGSSGGKGLDRKFALGWTILAEIDVAEAFAPVKALGLLIIWITIPVIIIVAFIAYFISKWISGPIKHISEIVAGVGEGDLTVNVTISHRSDEIGYLTHSIHGMITNLRKITMQVKEGTSVLATSASEILTTTSELATSATETASAVSETTTTAEEVKQTAQVSSQKAKNVSELAQNAAKISQAGKKSTDDIMVGMDNIKDQMESIAESIIRLSDQSQAIGEIIATVDDLAEQSNLLAVNAAIEAAKAGEHGKGFAVVAQEVRSLAEQSKQATTQVKSILNEIQKATSAAVMVTEQGSKAVDVGVKQSIETGQAIMSLTKSITGAAQAGIQIATSNQEQLTGMDQVVCAIENIKNASMQSVDSTKQLEMAARNLDELGRKLLGLVERYKV